MKKLLISLIRLYQHTISAKTPPVCRFTPTCSAYAIEAIERFGVIRGSGLAIWRILRCNPFGKYGYDPVPEKPEKRGGKHSRAEKNKTGKPQKAQKTEWQDEPALKAPGAVKEPPKAGRDGNHRKLEK